MKQQENLLKIPFDQYSRQKIVFDCIDALREKGQKFTILDVGGYKGVTGRFQSNDQVKVLDIYDIKEENYIKGDGTDISFGDNSFDFVVSFDVLEHIPKSKRSKFLSECIRVSKIGIFMAHPTKTDANELAESLLNSLFLELHKKEHEWLKEHIEYGLPDYKKVNSFLIKNKLHTLQLPSNDISLWFLMQSSIFTASKFDKVGSKINDLYVSYNETFNYDGTKDLDVNYRVITAGLHNNKDLIKVKNTMSSCINNRIDNGKKIKIENQIAKTFVLAINELFIEKEDLTNKFNELNVEYKISSNKLHELSRLHNQILDSTTFKLSKKITKATKPLRKITRKRG